MKTETVHLGFIYDTKKPLHDMDNMMGRFRQLSAQYDVRTVLFSLEHLDLEEQTADGAIIASDRISQGRCELPSWMYNFALHTTADHIEKMRNLRKLETATVINPINRFIQDIVFEMLASLPGSHQFLLPSAPLEESTLSEYIDKFDALFLLSENTFHSPKAVVIKKIRQNDCMIYLGANGQLCGMDDLPEYVKKMAGGKSHVLMKGIDCLTWEERPLEARVCLQKGMDGEWAVAAMAAKRGIFSESTYYDTPLNWILKGRFSNETGEIGQRLADISLRIGGFLDFHIPVLGSCTLDYIFDGNGCPYLVHVGGFEQDPYFFRHSKIRMELLDRAFHYLLFLRNNNATGKGAADDMDKSSDRRHESG